MSRSEFESDPTVDLKHRHGSTDETGAAVDGSAAELVGVLDWYLAELQSGRIPDRAALLASHPALASRLDACLAGIDFVHGVTASESSQAQSPARLGEFQILRELGRGGMGVVYEAEQTSLRRRVALKVLRFGVVADPDSMKRFQREAETVARLHHTNIVPIFAVGDERGVQYYAMQYIAGRSLADVSAEAQRAGQAPSIPDVARWGLQAAEALAHAHQRGVIHRDIKPSNLLLDVENVVWLTDFGLSKNADEVTLTASGALMGTPRYMSPEQAEAMRRPVDHRTDIYSLGATLYELATGRPVFDAATPHGVLSQIIHEEPKQPRSVRPELPRDLETVILTCLSKDATKRYATAQALADDLRAVLDGRPILARRAPWTERLVRAVHKNRKTVQIAATAAAASLVLVIGAVAGWNWYTDWRLGRVILSTDVPSLTAQVVGHDDAPATEPFTIGARTPVALPAGEYRLKVKAPGRLGRTFRVGLNQGETLSRSIGLDEHLLLGSDAISYSFATEAVAFGPGRKADIVEWTGQTLIRRDGATGKPIWDLALPPKSWPADRDPLATMRRLFSHGDDKRPGRPVAPAPDLNGDGIGDLVWAFVGTPSLMALSGKDGSLLWTYSATAAALESAEACGRVFGTPGVIDVDGDGTLDVVSVFAGFEDANQWASLYQGGDGKGWRTVDAVSGRTGKRLWSRTIDAELRVFTLLDTSQGVLISPGTGGRIMGVVVGTTWLPLAQSTAPIELGFAPLRPVQLADLDGDGQPEVLALGRGSTSVDMTQSEVLTAVSITTGKPLWTVSVRGGYRPQAVNRLPPEWPLVADLDGDGRPEVMLPDWGNFPGGSGYRGVARLDGATGMPVWSQPSCPYTRYPGDEVDHLSAGPDLDGDGVRDVVAVSRFHGRHPYASYAGRAPEPTRVFVEALSGKDGQRFWEWHQELEDRETLVWPPRWWGRGPDGGPLLALAVGGNLPDAGSQINANAHRQSPEVHMLAVGSGREESEAAELGWIRSDDLDGDGVADLWGMAAGKLRGFHGEAPEAWRALGQWIPAGDLDGDGVADLVTGNLVAPPIRDSQYDVSSESRIMAARSGRDGHVLWQAPLEYESSVTRTPYRSYIFHASPEGGDFDGDAAPDILVRMDSIRSAPVEQLRMELRSGRTGRRIWAPASLPTPATELPEGYESLGLAPNATVPEVFSCDVDGSGRPDLVLRRGVSFLMKKAGTTLPPNSPIPSVIQTRVTRVSGKDGSIVFDSPMNEHMEMNLSISYPRALGDLDGDGQLDVVSPIHVGSDPKIGKNRFQLCAISLRDGKPLWFVPWDSHVTGGARFAVGDIDGDGRAEVVVVEPTRNDAKEPLTVRALKGADGAPLWTWRGGGVLDRANEGRTTGLALADFAGNRTKTVCLNVGVAETYRQRLLLLDARGLEVARKELGTTPATLDCADLDGDGRDEVLVREGAVLRCLGENLKEHWSRPDAVVRQVLPAREGATGTVVINPVEGLDGATGQPRWSALQSAPIVFDPGGKNEPPRLMSVGPQDMVCRLAVPTDSEGIAMPPRVGSVLAGSVSHLDPRWRRPLPWVPGGTYNGHPLMILAMAALALVCLVVPYAILRGATRRRFWGLPLVLAVPVVAAVFLSVIVVIRTTMPIGVNKGILGELEFMAAILMVSWAGLPSLIYVYTGLASIHRRRWRRLALLLGATGLSTLALGAYMIHRDRSRMPAIESFDWSEWYHLVPWGVYLVGAVLMLAGLLWRLANRIGRKPSARLASTGA